MSTTLLIGRWPAAIRRALSHGGEGAIVTSLNTRAVKRGLRSGASTRTSASATGPGAAGSSAHGGGANGAPVAACSARGTPDIARDAGRLGVIATSMTAVLIGRTPA